jgi:Fe-S-cluster containining protein
MFSCKNKCCKGQEGAFPLSIMKGEIKGIETKTEKKINIDDFKKNSPCIFFNNKELCEIYNIRPLDCAVFPFDILKINGKYRWIFWHLPFSCSILKNENFEPYLQYFEKELIPEYKSYIEEFSKIDLDFFINKFKYTVIREVKLN